MVDQLRNVLTGPQMYQMFAGLGQAYTGAQDRARKNDREDAERAMYARLGDPNTDFGTMARGLMSLGKVPEGAALYGLAQKDQERAAEAQWMRQFGGGGGAAPASPAMGGGKAASAPAELMPFFQEASQRTGVPVQVLMAKAQQESSFNPNARGKAGEIGLTQIMPSTARDPGFGMQGVDPSTLNDPRQNILFGAQYLAARGKAAGVTNWNDPAQIAKALENYNGGGDPNYAANVMRYMQTGQMPSPQQVAQAPAPASDAPAPGAVPAQAGFVVPGSAPEAPSIANDPAVQRAADAMRTAPTERTRARAKIDYDLAIKAAEERALSNRPTNDYRDYTAAQRDPNYQRWLESQAKLKGTNVTLKNEGTIPTGYRAVRDAQGNVTNYELVPGSPAAKEEAESEEKRKLRLRQASIAGDSVFSAIDDIERLHKSAILPTTGPIGAAVAARFPLANNARDIAKALDTIKANVGFDYLQRMRESSPTGGALGNVSNIEIGLLNSTIAALEQSQSPEQFNRNLARVRYAYERAVHGKVLTSKERAEFAKLRSEGQPSAPAPSRPMQPDPNMAGTAPPQANAPAQQPGVPQGARQAPDGNFYVPDPQRPGKFLMVQP